MRLRQNLENEPERRVRSRGKGAASSIRNHKIFIPMLTAWGAALLGLCVLVLPDVLIARMAVLANLVSLGMLAKFVFAAVGALLGGGLAFVIAAALRDGARAQVESAPVVSAVKSRRIHPINPATDLGTESLDAPIEEMPYTLEGEEDDPEAEPVEPTAKPQPTLGELAARGYEIEEPRDLSEADGPEPSFTRSHFKSALIESCEGASCEAAPVDAPAPATEKVQPVSIKPVANGVNAPKPLGRPGSNGAWSLTQFTPPSSKAKPVEPTRPRELDLAEFAELPGRNAVWVEDQKQETATAPKPRPVPASALEKLRQTPPEELSLVEMVERFAGALHEHQQKEQSRLPRSGPARDAALAEALKALTLFTERGFDHRGENSEASDLSQTERELRAALVKLQTLRGAA